MEQPPITTNNVCPFCKARVTSGARFCGSCGKKLFVTQEEAKVVFAEKTTYAQAA